MDRTAFGLCLGLAVLVAAAAPAAADVVVFRGSTTEVVSPSAGGRPVTVLRGTPGKDTASSRERRQVYRQPAAHGVQGTGENLWTVDSRGRVRASWLTGTRNLNSLKVVCTR
jgi:hypothetical protein